MFCSHCNELVTKSGNTLLIPSRRSLQDFMKCHPCFAANTSRNLCNRIRIELIQSQAAIHEKACSDKFFAQRQINILFPSGESSTHVAYHCKYCGYSNKNHRDFLKHFRKKGNALSCNQLQHASDKVEVIVGRNGMKCPKQIIDNVLSGEFPAAFSSGLTISSPPNKRRRLDVSDSSTSTLHDSSTASLVTPMQGGTAQRNTVGTYTNSKHIVITFHSNLTSS